MTKCWKEEMSCSECDAKVHVDLYDFIDANENPDLREELLCSNINVFKCESCGISASMLQELTYIDEGKDIRVYLHPIDNVRVEDFIRVMRKDGFAQTNANLDLRDLVCRILPVLDKETYLVFSMEEMLLYVELKEKLFDLRNNILRPEFG